MNTSPIKVLLVHGTFARGGTWHRPGSALYESLASIVGHININTCEWSGWNSPRARRDGADRLRASICELSARPQDILVIAHSHGGNLVLQALEDEKIREKTLGVCTLATPFINVRNRDLAKADWLFYSLYLLISFSLMALIFALLLVGYGDTPFAVFIIILAYVFYGALAYQLWAWVVRKKRAFSGLPFASIAVFLRSRWRMRLRRWQVSEITSGRLLSAVPFRRVIAVGGDEAYALLWWQCRLATAFSFVLDKRFTYSVVALLAVGVGWFVAQILAALGSWLSIALLFAGAVLVILGPLIIALACLILVLHGVVSMTVSRLLHFIFGGTPIGLGSSNLWDGVTTVYSVSRTPEQDHASLNFIFEEFEVRRTSPTGLKHCSIYESEQVIASIVSWTQQCVAAASLADAATNRS